MGRRPDDHPDLFGDAAPPAAQDRADRALIEQLIAATRLYDTAPAARDLLDFVARLRSVAPFNAMLLHVQKPGITHVANATDWATRFGRYPVRGARPLVILRHYGPVDFVFDFQDTEGHPLPEDAFTFPTLGNVSDARFADLIEYARRERFTVTDVDTGDASAGWVRVTKRSDAPSGKHAYEIGLNRNHARPTQLVTLAHELGHVLLGHLGPDPGRRVPDRRGRDHALIEMEAESVAYLVARRNGLTLRSGSYLASFGGDFSVVDWHAVMRAANAVETALGVSAHRLWEAG